MSRDELQGRHLQARGVPQALLSQAWGEAQRQGIDLCQVLLTWQKIPPVLAEEVRRAAAADASALASASADGLATLAVPTTAAPPSVGAGRATRLGAGQEFGRYAIEGELSRGGMGVIYRARHTKLDQPVALKVMLSRAEGELLARFEREAQTLAKLKHPNIVRVSDFGEEGQLPFFTMELVDGRDLEVALAEARGAGDYDPRWLARLLAPVADALVTCHENGVIHRDLKPQNILVERGSERPVLVDFGLARPEQDLGLTNAGGDDPALLDGEGGLTRAGSMLGTPAYMAPEQVEGETAGEATDVWGFGATLFYCLSGERPYEGASAVNLVKKLLTEEPRDLAQLAPATPRPLLRLVRRCLRREPLERATMREVADALRAYAEPSRRTPALLASVALVALAGIGLAASRSAGSTPPPSGPSTPPGAAPLLLVETLPPYTRAASLTLRGKTAPDQTLALQGRGATTGPWVERARLRADASGAFAHELELTPGAALELRLCLDAEPARAAWSARVARDVAPPRIEPDGVSASGLLDLAEGAPLSGRISDASPVTLEIGGEEIPLEDGRFRYVLPAGADEASLRVVDAAGNRQALTLRVARGLGPLLDREAWARAEPARQDAAIQAVATRLGPAFRFLHTRSYEAGGRRHRIAAFEHARTRIVLHLLPGGRFPMGLRDRAAAARAGNAAVRHEVSALERAGLQAAHHPLASILKKTPQELLSSTEVPPGETLEVRIAPFLIGAGEVLQSEWQAVSGAPQVQGYGAAYPQTNVHFDHTLNWLELAGDGLRLPSEAEFEYAARAGTTTPYWWGEEPDLAGENSVYWLHAMAARPRVRSMSQWFIPLPVLPQGRAPNAFGLVDTLGNAWEWCADDPHSQAETPRDGRPFRRAQGSHTRIRRGGGMLFGGASVAHVACRGTDPRDAQRLAIGFRVACSIPR